MKYLKLYENFNSDDDYLLNIVKLQALQFNSKEKLDFAIDLGFDLEKYKKELIRYCEDNGWYDPIKLIDPVYHQELVGDTFELDISEKDLKNLQLNTLTNLTHLYCSDNDLTSLKGIENLTNLTYLSCINNNLTSLNGIENLTNLKELYCSDNKLTSLKGIENLTNLTYLYCSDNKLTSLKGIENLTNLKKLNYHNNPLPVDFGIYETDEWREYYRNN